MNGGSKVVQLNSDQKANVNVRRTNDNVIKILR